MPVSTANPFSTRFIAPAAFGYLPAQQGQLAELLGRFEQLGRRGQILGPHGSGKSTLLHALRRELEQLGTRVHWYELHEDQRRLPCGREIGSWDEQTVVVVDGYEQLSWWARWRLGQTCRTAGCGLLVTTHAPQGLPMLYRTEPRESTAQQLVARLMQGHEPLITPEEVTAEFRAAGGNLREMLFRLYDLYELRLRCAAAGRQDALPKNS